MADRETPVDAPVDPAIGLPCMMPSCERVRPSEWAICATCHQALPFRHRQQIDRATIRGMTWETATGGMRLAIAAARAWMLEAFGAERRDKDPNRWERLVRWVREKDAARRAARAAGVPIPVTPRCPSPACPCPQCVVEYGAPG